MEKQVCLLFNKDDIKLLAPKQNHSPHVNSEFISNGLTDIKGIKYVAGALCVVAPPPEIDDVIQEHSCVAISHVWHLTGSSVSSCPHWRQLHPAQRH